jgi:hypothetical protein
VDGAPAARFIHRLTDLIESGHRLEDALQDSAVAAASTVCTTADAGC